MLKGRQYLAPIENPRHAIDLAAGTGIWAILFARQYPDCNVIATELSMIQPLDNTPHNLTYLREDAEDPWIFEHRFDFVHLRGVATAFADHKAVMQQVFDNLEPGGWCEYDDYSFENVADPGSEAFVAASPATKYLQLLVQGLVKLGKDPWATRKYRRWMAEIGFVDIVEKQILCPVNGWPLDPEDRLLGHFTRLGGDKGILGSVKLMVAAGMPQEEIPAFLDIAVRSWTDPRYRAYSVCKSAKHHSLGPIQIAGSDQSYTNSSLRYLRPQAALVFAEGRIRFNR